MLGAWGAVLARVFCGAFGGGFSEGVLWRLGAVLARNAVELLEGAF